jgi:hypothetical protein
MSTPLTPTAYPWMVSTGKHILVESANGKVIGNFGYPGTPDEKEWIANAALTASAPHMLEALIDLQEKLEVALLGWERESPSSTDERNTLIEMQDIISAAFEKINAEVS